MKFAAYMIGGCLNQIEYCRDRNRTSFADYAVCTEAADMCRDNVEGPYYAYGGRGVYDIRYDVMLVCTTAGSNHLRQASVRRSNTTRLPGSLFEPS